MNTFKIKNNGMEMFVYGYGDDIAFKLTNMDGDSRMVYLDQVSMDALRNYLDDLESEE